MKLKDPCSLEEKLWQHIKKQRHHFIRGPYSQSYGFSSSQVQMWELNHKEGWVLKNWWSWTVVFEKTLESSLDYKDINQSILKEISPEYSLEGLMLKLKLQYFGHWMRRTDLLEETLMLGKTEGRRRGDNRGWDGWMASPTQWTCIWASSGSWWWTGKPGVLQSMGSQRVRHDWATELNWTVTSIFSCAENLRQVIIWATVHLAISVDDRLLLLAGMLAFIYWDIKWIVH